MLSENSGIFRDFREAISANLALSTPPFEAASMSYGEERVLHRMGDKGV